MEESSKNLGHFVEFETKYRAELKDLNRFKFLIEKLGPITLYCEGPDEYFLKPGSQDSFKRFRHATYPNNCGKQITTKVKLDGAKNNIHRIEKNLDVTPNSDELIRQVIEDDGYVYNFTVWKACHIYKLSDATLVFYTVVDTTPGTKYNEDHFIEIEVDEELTNALTEKEAWEIIEKYEKILAEIGIHAQKRIRKSLYEMYVRR